MKTSIKLCIIGFIFLIGSFTQPVDLCLNCCAIFFVASFVTEEIERLDGKNKL